MALEECGVVWKISQLLFANDIALVVNSEEKFCQLVKESGRVYRRKILRVYRNRSNVMKCTRGLGGRRMNIALNGELFEAVEDFRYFGYKITVDEQIVRLSLGSMMQERCWEE